MMYLLCLVSEKGPRWSEPIFRTKEEARAKREEWYAGPLKGVRCFVTVMQDNGATVETIPEERF